MCPPSIIPGFNVRVHVRASACPRATRGVGIVIPPEQNYREKTSLPNINKYNYERMVIMPVENYLPRYFRGFYCNISDRFNSRRSQSKRRKLERRTNRKR